MSASTRIASSALCIFGAFAFACSDDAKSSTAAIPADAGGPSAPDGGGSPSDAGDAGKGDAAIAPSAEELAFFDAYAHAVCDNVEGCCTQQSWAYDKAKCLAFETDGIKKLVAGRGGRFDVAKGNALVDAAAASATQCADSTLHNSPEERALRIALFTLYAADGTGAVGAPCATSHDCAPVDGAFVTCGAPTSDDPSLRCIAYRSAAAGLPCGFSAASDRGACEDGLPEGESFYCASSDACKARVPSGGACMDSDECVLGLHCADSKCTPLEGEGGACTDFRDCAVELYCNGGTTCAPLKGGGEACSNLNECRSKRCDNGQCRAVSSVTAEVCGGSK